MVDRMSLRFTADVYLFFFIYFPRDLRSPLADRRETFTHKRYLGALYNSCPKFRGPHQRNLGSKHAKFLQNESRYPKSERRDRELFLLRSAKEVW